jgi:hypothetical protein
VSRERRQRAAIRQLAARRVEAAWACVKVLRPDLSLDDRKALAAKFLDLGREGYTAPKPIRISPAQVTEIVWRNSQCANRHCSMVLFSREIAAEVNEIFRQQE